MGGRERPVKHPNKKYAMKALLPLVMLVAFSAGAWKTFVKAGKPGWAAIVPFYNFWVMIQIAGKPWWWFILLFVPVVGIVIMFLVFHEIAKSFGKGIGFTIGLILLGFGDATYQGDQAALPPTAA